MPLRVFQRRRPEVFPVTPPAPCAAHLLRTVTILSPQDELRTAVYQLHAHSLTALPVVHDGHVVAWLTDRDLARHGTQATTDAPLVGDIAGPVPAVLTPSSTLTEMLAALHAAGASLLPVVSADGYYLGIVTLADVLAARQGVVPAPRIGGMATPLGVYLTTGKVSGGVGMLGLMLTGAVMSAMLWFVQLFIFVLTIVAYQLTQWEFLANLLRLITAQPLHVTPAETEALFVVVSALTMVGFMAMLRFMPRMAGYHAAEHQTVNAIEMGAPLTPQAVSRQPRVHPRCGTNLWAFMTLTYLGVALVAMLLSTEFGRANLPLVMSLVVGYVLVVVVSWRRVGAWLQTYITTRRATPKELASGIRAGEDLLRRHLAETGESPRALERFWRMGLAQVMIGVVVMGYLLQLLQSPLDKLLDYLVR